MGRIDRNVTRLLIAAAAVFAVLVIASSGGAVQVWQDPTVSEERDEGGGGQRLEPQAVTAATLPAEDEEPPRNGWLAAVAIVLLSVLAAMVIWSLATTFPRWRPKRRSARVLPPAPFTSLPGSDAPEVTFDEEAQLDALRHGSPRNAIVECWLQMEHDVALAGWPKHAAETSTEYTTRVLASTSLDSSAVHDLAALYREARFSRHELDQGHRERAVTAVLLIHGALASRPRTDAVSAGGPDGPTGLG
jgi:hypothetical protein